MNPTVPTSPLRLSKDHPSPRRGVIPNAVLGLACLPVVGALHTLPASAATYAGPTHSSPIAVSNDDRLVWSVNPKANSVSVLDAGSHAVLASIGVGREPQSLALAPDGSYAYVANAASNSVTIIRVTSNDPARFQAQAVKEVKTGGEPWNVVITPDGKRVFVANSTQDTLTVLNGESPLRRPLIGQINLRNSLCNDPDRQRRFLPRGLAVTQDNSSLYVTRFFAYTQGSGKQADDNGRQGAVCRLSINTQSKRIRAYQPRQLIALAPRATGFSIDANGDGTADGTAAFPNQMQSIVLHGDTAYLPNIAASPSGPLKFNVDTHAFVNLIKGASGGSPVDGGAINLHLGARDPEPGKQRLFFANPWAIAFTRQAGESVGYVVSSGSDLLVKVRVKADGTLENTVDANTTRYLDLNDPANPATQEWNACKNPLGLAIRQAGDYAFIMCRVSGNVSIVDLRAPTEAVARVVQTGNPPKPGTREEEIRVGAEMFFSSRGHFDRPAGTNVSTENRLSSEGWQNCASCHFEGLTDSVVWAFGTGPRKSVPLNGSFNPHNPEQDQRVLNYSAIFDEVEDFEINIRNVSGPGNLAAPVPCSDAVPGAAASSSFDPNHGLLIGDSGSINTPPCTVVAFAKPNAGRQQVTVTLPGSNRPVPALTALRQWVQFAIRTPNAPLTNREVSRGVPHGAIKRGRKLFAEAGCASCHGGGKWTTSTKAFVSPPAVVATEKDPNGAVDRPNPTGAQFLPDLLADIGSFNLNVAGLGNELSGQRAVGGVELDQAGKDALGRDHDGDSQGEGFNIPSLLGIGALPPYLHNGACETLACVMADRKHRTGNGRFPDVLSSPGKQAKVIRFLESITAQTQPF